MTPRLHAVLAVSAAVTVALGLLLGDGIVPFSPWELLRIDGAVGVWMLAGVPLLLFGVGINVLWGLLTWNIPPSREELEPFVVMGCLYAIVAAVLEEVQYRWLLFIAGVVWCWAANIITLGGAEWLHVHVAAPVVDVLTLGQLSEWLNHQGGWQVGAGLVFSNALFRLDHKVRGRFNALVSWFVGLYLFWLMVHAGLGAAMIIHWLYDALIFLTHKTMVILKVRKMLRQGQPPTPLQ